jgi:hypothetical protein
MVTGAPHWSHDRRDHAVASRLDVAQPHMNEGGTMTQHAVTQDPRSRSQEAARQGARPAPDFKPVALPALAAAVRASRIRPRSETRKDLPAILRKETEIG